MTAVEFGFTLNEVSHSMKPHAIRLTKDEEKAKDLLQETIIKAYTNREKFATGTNLKAWFYTIMKNTFITNYQRMNRRNMFIDVTDNLHFINSSDSKIENNAFSNFATADISKAVSKLSNNFRVPFMMHYRGFKYHEIAERLSLPIGTVKNRIHIARKELKHSLKNYTYKNV